MKFKVLRHKTLSDTYGMFEGIEIFQCAIPWLFPTTATKDLLIHYWTTSNEFLDEEKEFLIEQLNDYDLVLVNLEIEDVW
jgi:hypothetical protein